MTLLAEQTKAGWYEYQDGQRWVAERSFARPGATASTVRVEADSAAQLRDAVTLRESQLAGADAEVADVITNDGTLVTDAQHEALRAEGVTVSDAEQVKEPVPNEDEAKQVAGQKNAGFNPDTPYDPTEASVNTPQVPSDAADQGLSPEAVSASETGSGSADTSTEPTAQAEPASFPPPEGQPVDSLPEDDHTAVLADAPSDEAESQNTPSDEVDATDAARALAAERGVDLSTVRGTGKNGRVTKDDVDAASEQA